MNGCCTPQGVRRAPQGDNRRAVATGRLGWTANRARIGRKKGKKLLKLRGELIERTFALACETGAHRRLRLRGRDNARRRYIAHAAALNLGLLMRTSFGCGTPREMAAAIAAAWTVVFRFVLDAIVRFGTRVFGTVLLSAADNRVAAEGTP
jgi:hypothetical protein